MPDEQWDKVGALLEETLDRPRAERDAFLRERCDDPALRKEVASLVELYEEAPAFFEDLADSSLASMLGELEEEARAGSQASDPLELEGTSVGRYQVEEHLDEGGMGIVYKARDTRLGRAVALKFLPPHLSTDPEAERRFVREARAAAALDHPNVATIHEVGETEGGRRFIAMAYYEGETLKAKLAHEGPLPLEEALGYVKEIAEGLLQAHEAGIVHRDIKPDNVMVTGRGEVTLLDFGIAKLKGRKRITETGDTLGTAAYMAPEQLQGQAVDQRADLFSLGVVFYEMLTGRHPFPGEHRQTIAYQIIHEEVEPPSTYREELPAEVDKLVLRCLVKEPTERYRSAGELLSDLKEAMPKAASSSSRAEGPASARVRSGQGWLRKRPAAGIGAIGTLMVVLLMGWWLLGRSPSEDAGEAVPSGGGPEFTEQSVAVLPFTNLSAGEEVTSVTRGLHDDLLTRLSNIDDLQVRSRPSVEQYRGTELSLPAVAESLDVRWIVEGRVQEAGDQVQVNAQLIDPKTDAYVWADRYQRELTAENLFAIQEEIANEIAGALETKLTAEEQERIADVPTEDLDAYRFYVQGRQRLAQFAFSRPEILVEAAPYFRSAIERDSSFALAWAGLADAAAYVDYYQEYYDWPDTLQAPAVDKEEAARRALQLDPDLAEAHASMGFIRLRAGDAPKAAGQLRRAIELKPSYWEAHQWLGYLYLVIGRAQDAVDHLELALELNPEHALARHFLYDAYLAASEVEKSFEEVQRQQRLGLEGVGAVGGEVRALYRLGRLEEARRLAEEQVADLGPETPWGGWFRAYLVGILAAEEDTTEARVYLDQLRAAEVHPSMLAHAYAAIGNTDQALETYQRLEEDDWRRVGPSVEFRYGTVFDVTSLRADPRYDELLREANRAWNLNPDGSIPEKDDPTAGL